MKLFAIFGNPVQHSRSPLMHNYVFQKLGYKGCYTRILLEDGAKLKDRFFALGLSGANITVPHKEAAFHACDEIRGFAQKVGVVNTIINENGRLIGYNTDADGFMYAIKPFGSIKKILVLGAGGTAKALVQKFLDEKIEVTVLNRSSKRLTFFAEIGAKVFSWDDFVVQNYDLVVNTTSAGLEDEALPAPKEIIEAVLDSTRFCADAIYGKITPFLSLAKEKELEFIDGSDMLLSQGVLAHELFVQGVYSAKEIYPHMKKTFSF